MTARDTPSLRAARALLACAVLGLGAAVPRAIAADVKGPASATSSSPASASKPAAIAGVDVPAELRGAWQVVNFTMNGEVRADPKLVGATWTFDRAELWVESPRGDRQAFSVAIEPGAAPAAMRIEPRGASTERGGYVLYERDGQRLRLAFMDNLQGRPAGFAPAPKLIIATLEPRQGGVSARVAPATTDAAANSACARLLDAGARELLGSSEVVATAKAPEPMPACRVEGRLGLAITLVVVRAADRTMLERERAKLATDPRNTIRDEPMLGPWGFSATYGNRWTAVTRKGDALVTLAFDVPPGSSERLIAFARRVLATL